MDHLGLRLRGLLKVIRTVSDVQIGLYKSICVCLLRFSWVSPMLCLLYSHQTLMCFIGNVSNFIQIGVNGIVEIKNFLRIFLGLWTCAPHLFGNLYHHCKRSDRNPKITPATKILTFPLLQFLINQTAIKLDSWDFKLYLNLLPKKKKKKLYLNHHKLYLSQCFKNSQTVAHGENFKH